MKCPECNNEMIAGKAFLGGGAHSLIRDLTFKADKWSNHVMQESSDVLTAHYCDNCGSLTLDTGRKGLSTLES